MTTKERALVEALEALRADSPAIICSRLKESLTRYEAAVKGVDETYVRLEEEQGDDRTYEEWSAKHSEYLKPKEEKIAEVVQRISEWEAAAYAAHAQAIRDSPRQGPACSYKVNIENKSPQTSTMKQCMSRGQLLGYKCCSDDN